MMARSIVRVDQGRTRICAGSVRSMTNGAVSVEQRLTGAGGLRQLWNSYYQSSVFAGVGRRSWDPVVGRRSWSLGGLRAPGSATLNKPTATASYQAIRQPRKSDRHTGRFPSSHSQPYRSHSTIPQASHHVGTSPFDRPHPHPVITMERLFSSSWVALTKPSVILAGAGIQSPLSQKTWSGYA